MATKTQRNDGDVGAFLARVDGERRRLDALELCSLLSELTGEQPAMWGSSIVGFGTYRYVSGGGRPTEFFVIGFSPRKQNLTLYLMDGFKGRDELLGRLGKHSTGKACLYLKRLTDVDRDVLRELLAASIEHMRASGPG